MTLLSVLLIVTTLVTDLPSTDVFVSGHYGESSYSLEGDRNGGFSVQAQSVFDIDSVHRVFGEASYTWDQSHGNRFVENADYELLYPYLTVDTVGGGLRTETYFFRGGYRMSRNHIVWHASLQFRALQSYRDIDPRPKNKVADMQLEAGVGYTNSSYAWLVLAQIGRYKQNNEIKFYSELGESQIYHLVGPGAAYTRFSGSRKESYYHGFTAGASVAMMPRKTGWLAQADYRYFRVSKELHDNTYIPVGHLQVHAVDLVAGYVTPSWRILAQGGLFFRRGAQCIYGEAVNNTYLLLANQSNYAENGWLIGAKADYRLELPVGYMRFCADMDYTAKRFEAPATEVRWRELSDLLMDNKLRTDLAVRYAFPIKGRYSWFVQPAAGIRYYTKTTRLSWQVALLTGLTF